ncbi:poly(3-hydroxybutyrate) depolymerase-like isoform X2 [Littorina saxatilis]|uniref:Polyhydroxybutyrate depolymerase n=2 Tax=Littorina saxatilis TaxID=31220 RepID=A0AAN9G3J7_9CAEN
MKTQVYFVLCGFLLPIASTARLDPYNVDRHQISVSGISSGACMATQFHVVHSRDIMGVGMIAGAPYMCAEGSAITATSMCTKTPNYVSVSALQAITSSAAFVFNIDSTSHMKNDKVWIFSGTQDSVVNPGAGAKIRDYYSHYVTSGSIKTVFDVPAEHSMPTAAYGGQCDKLNSANYLNKCHYNAAFEMLNFIYGGHLRNPTTAKGSLIQFDQSDFFYFAPPITYSMDNKGYVYIPSGCQNKQTACKLHIAFHGCEMGQSRIGDAYVRHAGYNEVGEANNIIILYPQAVSTLTNPHSCWDWWGYTGYTYATSSGFQITAVYRMMDRVIR